MKVVQINAVTWGSTGKIVNQISETLDKKNIENYVFYAEGSSLKNNYIKISTLFSRKLHSLFSRVFGLQGYFSYFQTRKLLKKLNKIKPSVVHLHNLHHNFINLKLLLKYLAKRKIKTVLTLHDCWFFTGKCTHFVTARCEKWKEGCGNCPQLKKDNPSWFFDRTKKMLKDKKKAFSKIADLSVIGVSDWVSGEARQSILKDAKIYRIYNWVEQEFFYPRESTLRTKYGLCDEKFLILLSSAFWDSESEKFKDLLEISSKLSQDQQIVLLGNINSNITLPENIVPLGYINDKEQLAEINSCCDVYVHLSRADTFGIVIAEALACGVPAIVYNTTACTELIGENCGFVVDIDDIDLIIKHINLIQSEGKKHYSCNCVDFVQKQFNKEKLLIDVIDIYKD